MGSWFKDHAPPATARTQLDQLELFYRRVGKEPSELLGLAKRFPRRLQDLVQDYIRQPTAVGPSSERPRGYARLGWAEALPSRLQCLRREIGFSSDFIGSARSSVLSERAGRRKRSCPHDGHAGGRGRGAFMKDGYVVSARPGRQTEDWLRRVSSSSLALDCWPTPAYSYLRPKRTKTIAARGPRATSCTHGACDRRMTSQSFICSSAALEREAYRLFLVSGLRPRVGARRARHR